MPVLENLKPQRVFYYFEEITKIPHGSGNTKEISDYLVAFAKNQGLRWIQDESNNVIIFKEASKGYEKVPSVMLQGHMDMVCEKKKGNTHDFTKDPLKLHIEGDYISADGTTLGGDDGIAVAYGLALLEDDTLEHPALEVVFTVDEEIGLLGASALDASCLNAKYLINLDSEEEGILWAGCAGGMTAVTKLPVRYQESTGMKWKIRVSGLLGGHSGAEIDKNRANATLILARFLKECRQQGDYVLAELSGGLKDNAIPRDAEALILADTETGDAVAYGLALLEDDTLEHPALEVVFTVDEEIGLLGASALDASCLNAKYLINLDSEEEGILWAGCAGGMTAVTKLPVRYQESTGMKWKIRVSGLLGGHSGAEIDKNRANATLILARFLKECRQQGDYVLAELSGGLKDNAIPRDAEALILADTETGEKIAAYADIFTQALRKEYAGCDEGITVTAEPLGQGAEPALHPVSLEKVLFFLLNYPNGIQKMCGFIDGLVETSCNLGITALTPEALCGSASVRSSVGTAKQALADKIAYLTEFLGGDFTAEGDYPSWEYRQNSHLRTVMVQVYRKLYGKEPEVQVIHAGLECGLFYEKIPGLDCVSIGPDMKDIHTSEEKLSISSVQRVWDYLVEVLREIKE